MKIIHRSRSGGEQETEREEEQTEKGDPRENKKTQEAGEVGLEELG